MRNSGICLVLAATKKHLRCINPLRKIVPNKCTISSCWFDFKTTVNSCFMKYLSYLVFMKLVCELTEPLVIIEGVPLSEQLRATAVRLSDIDLSCVSAGINC